MKTRRAALGVTILAMVVAGTPATPAAALSASEVQARIGAVRASLQSVNGRLESAENRLDEAINAIERHDKALRQATTQRVRLERGVRRRVAELYMNSSSQTMGILESATDLAATVERLSYLARIRLGERGMLEEIRSLKDRADFESSELGAAQRRAAASRADLAARQGELSARLRELKSLQDLLNVGRRRTTRVRGFACPVVGPTVVSNNFGQPRPGGPHQGVDIRADHGQWVRAVLPARVVDLPSGSWWGIGIVIRDASGTEWVYAHLSARHVRVGEHLEAGELIGRVGCTGTCYGSHLHFEWHPGGGGARDPYGLVSRVC